jgi:YEATS domain-containing protein 4
VSANAFLTGKGTPEFAQSMEKEENERLESARKRLIEEADRLRAQLIVRENELQRLKQELEQ